MVRTKYLIWTVLILAAILAGISTLLYFRKCDYSAEFTMNTTPDVVYFNVLNWKIWNRKESGVEIEATRRIPVSEISSRVTLKDTLLLLNWTIKPLNDSVTQVTVCVSDPQRKLFNRLTAPFFHTRFRKDVHKNLLDVMRRMNVMLESFRYQFTGPAHFDTRDCVYINMNSTTREKTRSMIATVTELNLFVKEHDLGLNGHPFVLIHSWNPANDSINFDFCFPVRRTITVPVHSPVRFKTIEGMDAVRTEFHGNYSITDICWYDLAEKARIMGYRSKQQMMEVYYQDPHEGGNDVDWKSEIYLEIAPLNSGQ